MTTIADALPLDASSGGRFENCSLNWSKTALSCETLIVLTRPCLLSRRQFIFSTITSCLDFIFLFQLNIFFLWRTYKNFEFVWQTNKFPSRKSSV